MHSHAYTCIHVHFGDFTCIHMRSPLLTSLQLRLQGVHQSPWVLSQSLALGDRPPRTLPQIKLVEAQASGLVRAPESLVA